jgi:phosphohistidine phosphatase
MRVLIIRHAVAEERADGGDEARALTGDGRRKMRAAAEGLRCVIKRIDVLASSPLLRAIQTAEIVSMAYDRKKAVPVDVLKPGKPLKGVLQWVQGQPEDATVALVGHEPQLGMLASWLLSGERRSFVRMRKGAACLLEFPEQVKPGSGTLLWMLKPSQLRELGE